MKSHPDQSLSYRKPTQERSRYKVGLILEATVRLLERDGIARLTTNAIAAAAGVSVGTLYQFFPNKEAVLDALADIELAALSERLQAVMTDPAPPTAEARIAALVRVVAASYGGRHAAHRLVMEHSLTHGGGNRMAPLLAGLTAHLRSERSSGAFTAALPPADAFVLAHGVAGVLRAMIREGSEAPPQEQIEQALARLVTGFVAPAATLGKPPNCNRSVAPGSCGGDRGAGEAGAQATPA